MANYATLKAAIQNVVKTNGNNEITGALLQQTLFAMVNSLGDGYMFKGVATPTTNPGTPDQNIFYFATIPGTYSNFGGLVVNNGEACLLKWNGTWTKDVSGFASESIKEFILNSFFVGNGASYQSVRINGLKPGSKYRVTLFNPNYDTTGISGGGYLFSINSYNNGTQTFIAGTFRARPEYYDITIPTDSEYITIGGRAVSGERVLFSVQNLDILNLIQEYVKTKTGVEDFSIVDENGNAIVVFSNGHIITSKFDSSKIEESLTGVPRLQDGEPDLSIVDENGNILVRFSNGHIETMNFNSADVQRKLSYVFDIVSNNFPITQSGKYVGEKIQINKNGFIDNIWGTFTGLPMAQSFSVYGDYIVFLYGSPNYGYGSLWQISTKTKLADLTFPHGSYNAPHANVTGFSKEFASGNTDLPLLYVSQWDNEGGCFVYDIHIDGTVNLIQTIMTDGNMGAEFGLALGDWVIDTENGFIWSAKYKISASHAANNGMMFCKFKIPSTANTSVVLTASDILDSFEIDDKTADLTITQDKVINSGKMFITCGYGNTEYPGMLYVIDLLGKKLSAFLNITAIHSGEPEGLEISVDKLLYAFGGTTIYSLTF